MHPSFQNPDDVFDVAVVGFGPAGAVAASLLGHAGLRTFVCDKQREVYDKPRAIGMDHEVLRVLQNLGVFAEIEPHTAPLLDTEYYGARGQLIKRMTLLAPPYPLSHVPSVSFTQPPVERVLRRHVESLPSVVVSLGEEVTQLDALPDRVRLHLRSDTGQDGQTRSVQARYVIGCDGAGSTVRSLCGIALQDLKFDEAWLVADVIVHDHALHKLPATITQYCDPARPSSFIIGPGKHRRWEISINEGEDFKALATPEGTWPLLAPWLTPDDGVLWRQACYRFHALVAERWRAGRVFIAGDAAHQQPPFIGQGMCQGIRDVANLTWKLTAVLQGRADDALLDTYGIERKRHVEQLTERIVGIGRVIGERDVDKAHARDAALLAAGGGKVESMPRQGVVPGLEGGLIHNERAADSAGGSLFPQPWVWSNGERTRMDDVVGTGWRLVLSPQWPAFEIDVQQRSALALRLVRFGPQPPALQEADTVLARWFDDHRCGAALVRPDHCVYGVAATPQTLAALLDGLIARLRGTTQSTAMSAH